MTMFVRASLCGVLALLAVDFCPAAEVRRPRPRTGVVGTFGTLNSVRPRRAPAQQLRRAGIGSSRGVGRMAGSQGLGGIPGMAGGQGLGGLQEMTGMSGATSATSPARRSSGRVPQGSPMNLPGPRRTAKRNSGGSSVRSSLPPANAQR